MKEMPLKELALTNIYKKLEEYENTRKENYISEILKIDILNLMFVEIDENIEYTKKTEKNKDSGYTDFHFEIKKNINENIIEIESLNYNICKTKVIVNTLQIINTFENITEIQKKDRNLREKINEIDKLERNENIDMSQYRILIEDILDVEEKILNIEHQSKIFEKNKTLELTIKIENKKIKDLTPQLIGIVSHNAIFDNAILTFKDELGKEAFFKINTEFNGTFRIAKKDFLKK